MIHKIRTTIGLGDTVEIKSKYDYRDTESKWYKFWMESGYFHSVPNKTKKPFSIIIPPPNVTGCLHMGHALNYVLQDVLTRIKRMQGYETLCLPGTDHGGIATQNVVEKELMKEGLNRHVLGRQKFVQRVWEWRLKTGDTILEQLKKLGCSFDWDRTRFTMDETCGRAVVKAFVELYRKKLIYRGEYIVNWCPRCMTALSDIEVIHEEQQSKLWYLKYPVKGPGKGEEYIIVATTRPETMLGDMAVAVNPDDERYKRLIGKKIVLPITGREIPVISDDFVDMAFGTGAVKVTPFHDPNDFEMAARHKLDGIKVIDEQGRMTEDAGKYKGFDRFECRERIVTELESMGLMDKIEDYSNSIGHCYRCNTIIEPLVSEQWFLKMGGMARMGMDVVKSGRVKFVPERWASPYMNWLENLHDWCISRQIWWGHQIPVWYCPNSSRISENKPADLCEPIVSETKPEKCSKCGSCELVQDQDVLDTWFSSGLWPFSTLGWPEKTPEIEYFYPSSVLVTGHEILYLWVARMIMMGMELVKDIPYNTVYINGIVRDKHGKKMSKSFGNVIDPLDITAKYGTDALRFSLCSAGVMGRDLQITEDNFETARNFANKLWNASRFVMMNLEGYEFIPQICPLPKWTDFSEKELELSDRWILSEYEIMAKEVTGAFENYDISKAARLLYEFIWDKYCDWYVELSKPRLLDATSVKKRAIVQNVLVEILDGTLRLLHPVMPFITEEIWQNLKKTAPGRPYSDIKSIMIAGWPLPEGNDEQESTKTMGLIIKIISAVRNVRSEMNVPPASRIIVMIKADSIKEKEIISKGISYISTLARAEKTTISETMKRPDKSAVAVVEGAEIYVPLEGIIDIDKEKARLNNEVLKIEKLLEKVMEKLNRSSFIDNAPEDVVEKVRNQEKEYSEKKQKLLDNLNLLK